jgi:ASPIC and UnbV/FG-GAP-like repeat
MRSRLFFAMFAALIAFALLAPLPAGAEWLDYTDGDEVHQCDREPHKDEIYTMRMTPYSKALIQKIWFRAEDVGTLEVHVYPDLDGMPNLDVELITPVEVETADDVTHQLVDVSAENLVIDALLEFHVGLKRLTSTGAKLCTDPSKDWALRAKEYYNGEWTEIERDYFVKVQVEYSEVPTEFYFSDATEDAGLMSLGARMAWGDYDNDGDDDLLFVGTRLYKNNGDGTFTDVSVAAGTDGLPSNGGVWADFDNDGNLDYFAMVHSLTEHDRFIYNNGDGTFTDITDSALDPGDVDLNPTEGAGWGDYDKDGYLDLYIANYEMPGAELSNGTRDRLYHNNGDLTFTDVADALDLDPETVNGDYLCGRGVNWGDYNDDGWPDIHVSNYRLDPNLLYMNNGDGTFDEVSEAKGVQGYKVNGAYGHTIGSAWGDFNNDGLLDLLNANLAHPRFAGFSDPSFMFLNNGPPDYDFLDFTSEAQLIFIETNSEPCIGDYNNDGWADLLITNVYEGFLEQLYRNDGDATLTEVTYYSGIEIDNGWGATWVDFDDDGYLDLVSNKGLWVNNGNENHWIKVKLTCSSGDPFCIGAKVTLQTAHDKGPQAKEIVSGKGTTNSPPFTQHFGLNQCQEAWKITARFPNGNEVTFYNVAADQLLVIDEDDTSDTEPATPSEPSTCAEVDYSWPEWPDMGDDDDDDNDTAGDDDDEGPADDDDDDDDDGGCCG